MINLAHIFQEQDRLNKETALKHEEYQKRTREQLTRNYVFSALVELGELANTWNHHKIWKSTRQENRDAPCNKCGGTGFSGVSDFELCPYCKAGRVDPLREEYADVVHFVVSVAIGFDLDPKSYLEGYAKDSNQKPALKDSYQLYLDLYKNLVYANVLIEELNTYPQTEKLIQNLTKERKKVAKDLITVLLDLGYSLGFDDEEIEAAYFSKHKINQVRQRNNY